MFPSGAREGETRRHIPRVSQLFNQSREAEHVSGCDYTEPGGQPKVDPGVRDSRVDPGARHTRADPGMRDTRV